MKSFADLDLIEPLLRAVAAENYEHPTPIQRQAIPALLDGHDVLGCAQTGTGKTAAFALPVLQHLAQGERPRGKAPIKALVLSPTRELADQIGKSFAAYSRFLKHIKHTVIVGGVNENPQIATLRRGISVLVATPGRLLDLHGRGFVDLSQIEFFVLDEVDRMLDMGFIHDIRKVLKALPDDRQNLLFSATMPEPIVELASSFLYNPVRIEVTPDAPTTELVEQRVMFVERRDKRRLLLHLLTERLDHLEQAIVFTRTKHGANRLTKHLNKAGVNAMAIHGNKSQNARRRALDGFRQGDVAILVATDIAARGIDVAGVTHVFNFDLPNEPEVYVHRIGRTGRAGQDGIAIAFCDETEGKYLRAIERLTGEEVAVIDDHAYHFEAAIPAPNTRPNRRRRRSSNTVQGQARSDEGRRSNGQQQRRTDAPDQRSNSNNSSGNGDDKPPRRRRRRRRRRRSSDNGADTIAAAPKPNAETSSSSPAEGSSGDTPKPRRYRRRRRRSSGSPTSRRDGGSSNDNRSGGNDGDRRTYHRRRRQ
ncbi:MAG: DEAD/DEAH box helicase [Myxococcota bacterium]